MYKQQGKQDAIDLGLEVVGPKMATIVREVRTIAAGETHIFYTVFVGECDQSPWLGCWSYVGFRSPYCKEGTKLFEMDYSAIFKVLSVGGAWWANGSAKTEILQAIQEKGEPVLDLEGWPITKALRLVHWVVKSSLHRFSLKTSWGCLYFCMLMHRNLGRRRESNHW